MRSLLLVTALMAVAVSTSASACTFESGCMPGGFDPKGEGPARPDHYADKPADQAPDQDGSNGLGSSDLGNGGTVNSNQGNITNVGPTINLGGMGDPVNSDSSKDGSKK
jgi:hypothetical protein